MSALDQSLFVATVNYHVGHAISIRAAEDRGFFREEGLTDYLFDGRGMLPMPFEREALGLTMEQRGVDVAVAVTAAAALYQRALGADLFIVGGWRLDGPAGTRWYSATPMRDLGALRGKRIGVRERAALDALFLGRELRRSGVDPEREVAWVYDHVFYGDNAALFEELRAGRVDLVPVRPGAWAEADRAGFAIALDATAAQPGRPGHVIVATGRTVRERGVELRAFLRANLRAFWFVRDAANFDELRALDARWRRDSRNDDEHGAGRLATSPLQCETWPMPLDGLVERAPLETLIADLAAEAELPRAIPVDEVLRDEEARAALAELSARPDARDALARNRRLLATYGF